MFAANAYIKIDNGTVNENEKKRNLSSNMATFSTSHVVLDGASQCFIGKNVTQHSNILHTDRNALEISANGQKEYISLIEMKCFNLYHSPSIV